MLNTETFGQGPNLTLLHGWGAQNSVWQSWISETLAPFFTVTLIELPGFGQSDSLPNSESIEADWLNAIIEVLPEKTHLLGWSLGGLLAQKIAFQYPHRIERLICLASTPRFTQSDDWQWGVAPSLMSDFIQSVACDSLATLKHFWKLQIQGADGARQLIKHFMLQMQNSKTPSLNGLLQGLKLLSEMDCRRQTKHLSCPVLWLLGANDPLIAIDFIQDFISENSTIQPTVKVAILSGAAHMPFLSHPTETAEQIIAFLHHQNA